MKLVNFMKTAIVCSTLTLSSAAMAASPVVVFEDHEETWLAHPESFKLTNDGVAAMLTKKPKNSNRNFRFHVAVLNTTCKSGSGELFFRENTASDWEPLTSVSIPTEGTVGDKVAKILCAVGDHLKKKKTSTKI